MLNYEYRIYPTRNQTTKLKNTLELCRFLYNHFLEKRKNAYELDKHSVSKFEQQKTITQLKSDHPELENVHSQVLQNVAERIDLAFKAFFRRVKAHEEEPGYPRFKGKGRYDSITYPQKGFELTSQGLKLSKLGTIKLKYHRKLEGKIKTCTIKRSSTGKWYAVLACEHVSIQLPKTNKAIGLDLGLNAFLALSNNEFIDNPRFFRTEQTELARVQRKKDKKPKGTQARKQTKLVVSRVHERIANKRADFTHKLARKLVSLYDIICIEKLSIKKMTRNHKLAKSIHDAAWNQFAQKLIYKAEYAGKQVVQVNPAYTSQTCSHCGHREHLSLGDRIFVCSNCDLRLNRDTNASRNILALGIQSIGFNPLKMEF